MVIKSRIKEYMVHFENNLNFIENLTYTSNSIFVIDKNVYRLYKEYFKDLSMNSTIVIEAIEENKNIDTALKICERITTMSSKRNTTLIAIGGGIIQDIAGFVANIMYRGIPWIFIPSTLLAACDSCIGGKTSLNYKTFKNLLGTFYPPDKIYICPQLFHTLTEKDFKSGLGEVVKFNIMSGENDMEDIEENIGKLLDRDLYTINHFVKKSLKFKKKFIEEDEFDQGERIKLNFAHTFGHAIEVVTEYTIPHGTAVAIGMIMANYISYQRNWLSKKTQKQSENILLSVIDIDVDLLQKPADLYISIMRKDKKQIGNSLTAVLMSDNMNNEKLSIVHDISEEEVQNAIDYFTKLYRGV